LKVEALYTPLWITGFGRECEPVERQCAIIGARRLTWAERGAPVEEAVC